MVQTQNLKSELPQILEKQKNLYVNFVAWPLS